MTLSLPWRAIHPSNRWGHTPADDAEEFGHLEVAEYIRGVEAKLEAAKEEKVIPEVEEEAQAEQ